MTACTLTSKYGCLRQWAPVSSASTVLLGDPQIHLPDPLAFDKFQNLFTHQRTTCGRLIDSRRMTISLTPERREILVNELSGWLTKKRFGLLEAASICGLLSDAARVNRWAWPLFYQLRNAISDVIRARHCQGTAIARTERTSGTIHAGSAPTTVEAN